jgi:hypothetical protein
LKRDPREGPDAFENLRKLKERLNYPITILVMVDSADTWAPECPETIADQTVCFAVQFQNGEPRILMERCA